MDYNLASSSVPACFVGGANQHFADTQTCKLIVAVNSEDGAPNF